MYRRDYEESGNWYDMAQVCLNGHVVTEYAASNPEQRRDFCPQCGAKTIMECPSCGTAIKGCYHQVNVFTIGSRYVLPKFCYGCGKPYPWTEAAIAAAKDLVTELELSEKEKAELEATIDDLVTDNPRTQVSAMKFRRLVLKAGQGMLQVFRDILVDVLSDAAKKAIWGS